MREERRWCEEIREKKREDGRGKETRVEERRENKWREGNRREEKERKMKKGKKMWQERWRADMTREWRREDERRQGWRKEDEKIWAERRREEWREWKRVERRELSMTGEATRDLNRNRWGSETRCRMREGISPWGKSQNAHAAIGRTEHCIGVLYGTYSPQEGFVQLRGH